MTTATKGRKPRAATKPTPEAAPANGADEFDTLKAIQEALSGCSLTFHWWGIMRTADARENEKAAASINADADVIRTQRRLIDTRMEEWKNLQQIRSAAKQWYDWNTFPYVVGGQRLFRRERREGIWSKVREYSVMLAEATARLTAKRPEIVDWARKKLGDAFDESLYPADFANKFSMEIREHSIEPPSYLRHTNAEEYQRTLQRSLLDIQDSMRRFESQCMQQIGQNIGRIANNIANDATVRESTVRNMQETFGRIAQMRFEGTAVFHEAMKEAEGIINGVTLFDLRNSKGTRDETRKKLEALMARHKELQQAVIAKAAATEAASETSQS